MSTGHGLDELVSLGITGLVKGVEVSELESFGNILLVVIGGFGVVSITDLLVLSSRESSRNIGLAGGDLSSLEL